MHPRDLLDVTDWIGLKRGGDRLEQARNPSAEDRDGDQANDRNQSDEQAVFNQACAFFILANELAYKILHVRHDDKLLNWMWTALDDIILLGKC